MSCKNKDKLQQENLQINYMIKKWKRYHNHTYHITIVFFINIVQKANHANKFEN